MSAPYDLDDIPEAKRYAPQYRKPEEQACVDMIRRMRYETYKQELPTGSKMFPVPSVRPASAVPMKPLEIIAHHIRTMPFGDVVTMAEGVGTDPSKLWGRANK
jgi:hypothetical protein